jgi:hypothetical protein
MANLSLILILKPKFRRTYYLDTANYKLKSKHFFLRVRKNEESSKYQITLKYRHADRYISASYDLSGPTIYKTKFEEDIIAPHVSKFSVSSDFEADQSPEIYNLKDLKKIFVGIRKYHLGDGKLEKVNKFEAREISVKLGNISHKDKNENHFDNEVKTFLNFWYQPTPSSLQKMLIFIQLS